MAQEYPPSGQESMSTIDDGRAGTLKSKVQDVGARAAQRADQARVGAAAGLESVASTLHESIRSNSASSSEGSRPRLTSQGRPAGIRPISSELDFRISVMRLQVPTAASSCRSGPSGKKRQLVPTRSHS